MRTTDYLPLLQADLNSDLWSVPKHLSPNR